jgi:hypothetical protein
MKSSDTGARISHATLTTDIPAVAAERHAYRSSRSNMLLVGSDARVDALITAITGLPSAGLPEWDRQNPLSIAAATADTCLVRNAQQLDAEEQLRLNKILETSAGRIRVIATAAWPLYPLVARGEFHEELYYRLNMLCLELADDASGRS